MKHDDLKELLIRYGCGPVKFTGTDDALFERRLVLDHVIDPKEAGPREQFEALAGSHAGRACPALVEDHPMLRTSQPKAGLLPFDGVSHRTVAGKQRHESASRPGRRSVRESEGSQHRSADRAGTGRRARKWRARPVGGLLHRIARNPGNPCNRLRSSLRLWDLPARNGERTPGRTARSMAEST